MQADPIARAASTDRRQYPRWTTAGLESALGRVTDLSLSGMRIRKTGNPGLREGDRFRLEVRHEDGVFLLPAQLSSVRPHASGAAGGMVDLGVRFPGLTRAQKRAVKSILASTGFPDGGGEIVFQSLPPEEDAESVAPAEPTPGAASSPPDAASGMAHAEAPPEPAPERPAAALRSWSQLTEEADAPRRPVAAEPGRAAPAAAGSATLLDHEAAELSALRGVAADAGSLASEAAAAAAPVPSAPPAEPLAPVRPERGNGNQRKNGRLTAQDAHTALGQVLDISASGMRIRRRGARAVRVGDRFLLDLYVCGRAVRLPVEVMRIQKAGWRSHDYGLRFGELPPEMRAQFGQVARMAAKHVSIA